jgi:putative spermidine/putrescine transport system permease protein
VLGSCVAFALSRFRFFGQNTVSLLFVLPIALPGIVTGLALLSTIDYLGITPSLWTVVAGHATFCIVVVFNNVVARLRRTSTSLEEASMDLGTDGWQTFRHITLPSIATALVAGGLLAFALSFDEVVVTLFTAGSQQTLPLWIYNQFRLPNTAAEVNAVAVFVIALTAIPVYLAQRLMRDTGGITGR